jgi:hypothetical protein
MSQKLKNLIDYRQKYLYYKFFNHDHIDLLDKIENPKIWYNFDILYVYSFYQMCQVVLKLVQIIYTYIY